MLVTSRCHRPTWCFVGTEISPKVIFGISGKTPELKGSKGFMEGGLWSI